MHDSEKPLQGIMWYHKSGGVLSRLKIVMKEKTI